MKKLKTELKLCDHHYVRCLKPNEEKKALLFHPNFVFNQIIMMLHKEKFNDKFINLIEKIIY